MAEQKQRVLTQGLITGVIGYATVALYFAFANVLAGRPMLHTAALLGHRLLGRPVMSDLVVIEPQAVLVYNGLHLVVFLAVGLIAAWLVAELERYPQLWYFGLFLVVFVFFHITGFVLAFVAPVSDSVSMGSALGVGVAAVVTMGLYLIKANPGLSARVREVGDFEDFGVPRQP